jgi:PWI domain-containing protein
MQINLTGFLTDSTPAFMVALWNLLIEAQASPAGIPRSFVEEKKEEMRLAKEGDTRALAERDRRMRLDDVRERERSERSERGGGGRGRGRGRRGRGGFGNDDRSDNRTRDNGWSSRGGVVSLSSSLSPEHTSHLLHCFSVRDIALLRENARRRYVVGHLLATALLAPAALLLVALVLSVHFVHVQ